ncbi:hypothetical protein [Methanosarcina vacuolata]|uniref:Uncharacterized protein n=1 Tax=Methanosarcina vacuolata Z-761 TaxID=1434123 RepID=A0A0E3LH46_9EURY|nr:hypothetical protein [Methanosarcina vacuolata]AKB43636.1 hypothetical protein MSVAZ_1367 [Methanosarcina vacuolata Z-761]
MKCSRYFTFVSLLLLIPSPVYSMGIAEDSVTTISSDLQESYSISGNLLSGIQSEIMNLSNTYIVIQGNGIKGLGKSDEYGNYKFGNISSDIWLEHGSYSLTAFKYVSSEGKYLFGTANISLNKNQQVPNVDITLDWASEDEEKIIESFFPLLRYSLSGSVFSNVQNQIVNVSNTQIVIQGNAIRGHTKSDIFGNYYYGELYNPDELYEGSDLRYGNYSITAFKYIPSEEKFLFGTTNVTFNYNEKESDVNISLDWASKDEERIIESFFYLYEYSISGKLFSDFQNESVNVSNANIAVPKNNGCAVRKSDDYGNYKLDEYSIADWLECGDYSLTAFKYISSEGKYLFGTKSVSLHNNEEVSDVNITLDWASEDEEKIIENFLLNLIYSFSGSISSNIQSGTLDVSNANIIIRANGTLKGLTKGDIFGNYNYGDLDYGLNYGDYSLIAFKYVPSEGKYLFGTTNVFLKNVQNLSNVNITLDWASEDEENLIKDFLLNYEFRYLYGNISSNIQNETINFSNTCIVAKKNDSLKFGRYNEYGNYRFDDDNWLEHGNYSLTAFKYVPFEEKFLYGTTNVSLERDISTYNANISLDWASEDEETIIESFFPLLRYSLSGSVFSNIQDKNIDISNTNIIIEESYIRGFGSTDECGNYNCSDLYDFYMLNYGNCSVTAFKYISSEGKFLYGTTNVFLNKNQYLSNVNIALHWASEDEEKIIEDFLPRLKYSISGKIRINSDENENIGNKKRTSSSSGSLLLKYNNSLANITSNNSSNSISEAGDIYDEENLSMSEKNKTTAKGETQNKTAVTDSMDKAKAMPELASINLIFTLFLVFCLFKRELTK